jgi:hypothetical protein
VIRENRTFFAGLLDILEFQGRHVRFTIDTLRHTVACDAGLLLRQMQTAA